MMGRGILQDRTFNIAGTLSLAICVCLLSMIGVAECISDDIDETEGSTGEVDTTSWTSWSMWSKCSERCDGGLSNRTRYCATLTDSEADVDENSCIGHANEVRVCNQQKCPSGGHRQAFCVPMMRRFFHGKRYYWSAFIDPRRPCKSVCHARSGNYYVPTGHTVPDGTPCIENENDVCISGKCHKVGCDGIIGSPAKLDLCGVCKGQEKSCRVVRSNFTVDASLMKYGYNRIMTIPKGAFNINITELGSSRNYLAMKTKSGYSILNSNWRLSRYGYKYVLGTVMDYQRRSNSSCPAQCLFVVGPIDDDIHVQLLFYRESSHFTYQFSTPLDMNGGHHHVHDITGDPQHHHHRHNHQSNDNDDNDRRRQRTHDRRRPHHRSSSATTPDSPNGHERQESNKRRSQYNESFMAPHRSKPEPSNSEPTNPSPYPSPESTQASRSASKSYVAPASGSFQRTAPSIEHNGQDHPDRRTYYGNGHHRNVDQRNGHHRNGHQRQTNVGNGNHGNGHRRNGNHGNVNHGNGNHGNVNHGNGNHGNVNHGNVNHGNGNHGNGNHRRTNIGNDNHENINSRNGNYGNGNHGNGNRRIGNHGNGNHGTSRHNLRHRIPNRRVSSQWPISPIEPNQPVRQGGASVVLRAPSPTIVIANTRYSSDRIHERRQPIKIDNGDRYLPPNQGTSQLSLGSNSVRSSGQKVYLRTGSQVPDALDSSKSGSSITGDTAGYSWRISGFTECSQSCGGGIEETIVVCVKDNSQVVVTDENCDIDRKPETKVISCNLSPCHAEWFAGPWSECSATCGDGTQTRQVTCQQRISPVLNLTVSAEACRGQVRNTTNRTCSLQPCFFWKVGNWSQCSSSCGKGMRERGVTCMNIEGRPTDNEHRCQERRPVREELCDMGSCATGWFYTDWPKKCPVDCGEGIMKRNLHCAADDNTTLPDERCSKFPRPRLEKKCKADVPCGGRWFLGPWSKCNSTCGKGMETRDVVCIRELSGAVLMVVEENNCAMEEKQDSTRPCQRDPCPPQWYMMNWSECSKSCDLGHRTREVKCLDNQKKSSLACEVRTKPSIRESCNIRSCGMTTPAPVNGCSDILGQCHLVVRARLCNYPYYHHICCASCAATSEHEEDSNKVPLATTTDTATTIYSSTETSAYSTTQPDLTTSFASPSETTLASANRTALKTTEEATITTPNNESTDSQS